MADIKDLSQKDLNKIKNINVLMNDEDLPILFTSLSLTGVLLYYIPFQLSEYFGGLDTFIWDDIGGTSASIITIGVAYRLMKKVVGQNYLKDRYYLYNKLFTFKTEGKLKVMNINAILKKVISEGYLVEEFINVFYQELNNKKEQEFISMYIKFIKFKLCLNYNTDISDEDYYRILDKDNIYLNIEEISSLVNDVNKLLVEKYRYKEELNKLEVIAYNR